MRILHIIGTLDPQAGGPSNAVRRIVAAYPGIGSEGEVLTLDDPGSKFLQSIRNKGICVHALGPVATRFGYTRRLIPWLRGNRDRFDGVVVHGLWQYIGWAVRRAIHPHKPYLIFPHGMLDPYFRGAYPMKHVKKALYWLMNEYWVLNGASRVLFTSSDEAAAARESFWPCRWSSSVVPYGASMPEIDPAISRNAFLMAFPELRRRDGAAKPYLLFLGRMHAKKGCDLLLEAFSRIAHQAPDLHLVFGGPEKAGSGRSGRPAGGKPGLTAKLEKQADARGLGDRVHWTGMLDDDLKWGAFFGCEVFALPSHQENFGIAVAEALACGRPVLISDKVNIWRDIVHDGAGLVGPDNAEGTLRILQGWIALTSAQKTTMGANALDCFRRRYDVRTNVSGIVDIFSEILARSDQMPVILPKAKANAL